jgi:hypothetical protein
MDYTQALAELNDFGSLSRTIAKSLEGATYRVVVDMVAREMKKRRSTNEGGRMGNAAPSVWYLSMVVNWLH